MRRIEKFLAVIGAAALLWLGSAVATQAGNGSALKFGKINKGTKTTTLQVTSGTASPLKLQGNASSAPLVTNMTGQVANLNASKVGGASLRSTVFSSSSDTTDNTSFFATAPSSGTYLVTLSAEVALLGTAADMYCYLYPTGETGQDILAALGQKRAVGSTVVLNASRVVNLSGTDLTLRCSTDSGQGWSVSAESYLYGPTLSLTQVPSVSPSPFLPPPALLAPVGSGR